MFDGRWRHGVDRVTSPVGRRLVRWHITADVITASGLVFALATALVVASGHLLLGIPFLAMTGFHDLFDGPVAKASGTASVRGALFDSVSDRVADAILMGGVAWYLVRSEHHQIAVLPLAVLGAASLVSYIRAKADALGLPTTNGGLLGGLMERAERIILLGVGFLEPWLLVPVLWALFGLTMLTAAARFVAAWRSAEGPVRPVRTTRVESLRSGRRRRTAGPHRPWLVRRAGVPAGAGGFELSARWRVRRQESLSMRSSRLRARRARADSGHGRHLSSGGSTSGGSESASDRAR